MNYLRATLLGGAASALSAVGIWAAVSDTPVVQPAPSAVDRAPVYVPPDLSPFMPIRIPPKLRTDESKPVPRNEEAKPAPTPRNLIDLMATPIPSQTNIATPEVVIFPPSPTPTPIPSPTQTIPERAAPLPVPLPTLNIQPPPAMTPLQPEAPAASTFPMLRRLADYFESGGNQPLVPTTTPLEQRAGIIQVQDQEPQIPATKETTGTDTNASAKTLSGFGASSLKTLSGFGPAASAATKEQAPQSSVIAEPGPTTSPGAAGVLESNSAGGVELQRRSPLVVDPRLEGFHFGQISTYADGGYWFPARVDLDTVISKLSSDNILNVLIVKGPYSVRYGPGFSFLDIETLATPRFKEGYFDAKGSTSFGYRTNGVGFQGQQSLWGGNADWGFRLSYDLQSAQDYRTGNGTKLPTAYNNQFVDFAYGFDLDAKSNIELRYFHNQQSNVLFPGLLTDIVALNTDAFTGRLTLKDGPWYSRLTVDTWVNTTTFNGGSGNQATRNQIPQLDSIFPKSIPANDAINTAFGPVRLDMITNGYALSYGVREITTWGDLKTLNFSLGADLRVFSNIYNEFDAFNFSVANGSTGFTATPANLGIPSGRQIDPGLLFDASIPVGDDLVVKVGARVDFFTNQFLQFGPNVDPAVYQQLVGDPRDRTYLLFSGFATSEYKLTEHWKMQTGYGYAERPPTLTELYAGGAFLGLVQNGFNSIYGNPDLLKEQIHQFDLGFRGNYSNLRAGAGAFYAFLPDYITYQNEGPLTLSNLSSLGLVVAGGVGNPVTPIQKLRFKNTNLATMYGANAYGEYDIQPWLTGFGVLNYTAGRDQEINEPLPGIAPLDTRVGFRIHDPAKTPRWGLEYFARMVAPQDLFAASLNEQRTGGFVVHYFRAYWQVRDNLMVQGGIDNFGNLQYREHLDLRTGNGVFQPGISFFAGMKVNY